MQTVVFYLFGVLINLPYLLSIGIIVSIFVYMLTKSNRSLRYLLGFLTPFLIIQIFPLGRLIMTNLENKIERPELPKHIDGLILLGGTINGPMTLERGEPVQNMAGTRLYEFIELAIAHPEAKVLVTGTPLESDLAVQTLHKFGIASDRILLEKESRSTIDNVNKSYEIAHPKEGETWVMVTSAFHLYRASILFKKKNWNVIPYPVNYLTSGKYNSRLFIPDGLNSIAWHTGMKEYAGITALKIW